MIVNYGSFLSSSALSSTALLLVLGPLPADATAQVSASDVDEVFAAFSGTDTPGCTVAVSEAGRPVLQRAYGMADLEHDVVNTPETVLEPGSVAKQFTAAATILLALDGEISLSDDVRKYIPELPVYDEIITVRHLRNHTSGLRDWGSVAGIGGWPRTTRVHTHTHMLDIARRQKSLNYTPGEYYSYTNTGYNLQAVLVERVSGMSFAEFSRARVFEPLGMTKTQWRDDYTRIVKDRAIAYSPTPEGAFRQNMPFENVHGNGGLLTTVGDLLKFTHNFQTGALWGPEFVKEMHTQGILNSGREIAYASGLFVGEYKGVREIQHSGGTAGYRGFLTRFSDQGVAVAVMCNAGNANPTAFAHQVADLYLGDALVADEADPPTAKAVEVSVDRLEMFAGAYKQVRNQQRLVLTVLDGNLQVEGQSLIPLGKDRFTVGGAVVQFETRPDGGRPSAVVTTPDGDVIQLEPVGDFDPSQEDLTEFVGAYRNDEAEVTYSFAVQEGGLVVVDRYGQATPVQPHYTDAFSGRGGLWIFLREGGRVTSLSFAAGRVWDLQFERVW